MIILDYRNMEPLISDLQANPKQLLEEVSFGGFYGAQIIIVNSLNFSSDYPILSFARELNAIVYELKTSGRRGKFHDPYFESRYVLDFSIKNGFVTICHEAYVSERVVKSTYVSLEELEGAASAYLERLVTEFSVVVPALQEHAIIKRWLSDFSLSTPEFIESIV